MKNIMNSRLEAVLSYHEQTKHFVFRSASSPGYMDWANQPNPFRLFDGAEKIALPFIDKDKETLHENLYNRVNNIPVPLNIVTVAAFLERSMALSAWKAYGGEKWSLRMNPSSGNLHPTEAHLILPEMKNLEAGVFHYTPLLHCLEQRAELDNKIREMLMAHLPPGGFLLGLTSIFWRESWKYGERAFRYCNHDVGHALAALSISANLLGWKVIHLGSIGDDETSLLLGLNQTKWRPLEADHPDTICMVVPNGTNISEAMDLPGTLIKAIGALQFKGKPNTLSVENVNWEIIYDTADQVHKERTTVQKFQLPENDFLYPAKNRFNAADIIRKRRSGVDFDRLESVISKADFFSLLDKTLPRNNFSPFDIHLMKPAIHLFIFVHNVTGLEPGLYAFVRDPDVFPLLKKSCDSRFLWQLVEEREKGREEEREEAVGNFPLYLLQYGNFRGKAAMVSCQQAIAGDSAFSLGMVADFLATVTASPYLYRYLFWEAGMVGQVLYLEAEACGISATGIGCFFDDQMHEIMGLEDKRLQSLYHFTVGTAVVDHRLTTLPPYHHLSAATGS